MIEKWDKRFLDLAEHISGWSKDPSTKVGAVIVRDRRIVSVGYNGLPAGISDLTVYDGKSLLDDRDLKYDGIIHGEINALNFATEDVKGATLYTYPFIPCSRCASVFIQKKIGRVVSYYSENERWIKNFKFSSFLFQKGKVPLTMYTDRESGDFLSLMTK